MLLMFFIMNKTLKPLLHKFLLVSFIIV
uniref:Uncharacterized protein n=1 Tax=Arundo donax TaxID=35708 RepID=A0A0A9H0H9_ARUDO